MKTVQATVTSVRDGVMVRVRRSAHSQQLDTFKLTESFQVGDKLEVSRKHNNPYLVFVRKL